MMMMTTTNTSPPDETFPSLYSLTYAHPYLTKRIPLSTPFHPTFSLSVHPVPSPPNKTRKKRSPVGPVLITLAVFVNETPLPVDLSFGVKFVR